MKLWKVTDEAYRTPENTGGLPSTTIWAEGVTHKATRGGFIIAYRHPLLANMAESPDTGDLHSMIQRWGVSDDMFLKSFPTSHLWEADGTVVSEASRNQEDEKSNWERATGAVRCSVLTTLRRVMVIPQMSFEQGATFAVMCALEVYDNPVFTTWANSWLRKEDRTWQSANKVVETIQMGENLSANDPATLSAYYAASVASICRRHRLGETHVGWPPKEQMLLEHVLGRQCHSWSTASARKANDAKSAAGRGCIDILKTLEKAIQPLSLGFKVLDTELGEGVWSPSSDQSTSNS